MLTPPRGSMQKNDVKGDMEDEDTSAGQLTATPATSEFNVLGILRSLVCCAAYLEEQCVR